MNKNFCDTKKHTFLTVPWYGWVAAVITLVVHIGLYKIAYVISKHELIWSGFCPKIDSLDNAIPFVPWFFIQVYIASYLFWFICPLLIAKKDKANFINFMIGLVLSSIFVFFLFIFVPTWQDRTVDGIQEKVNNLKTPFTKFCMNFMIGNDGGNKAWNMAPSYHCLFSIYCFFGIMMQKEGKLYNRIWIGIYALLVCLATVFVKQHYFMDFVAAAVVAVAFFLPFEFAWKPGERIMKHKPDFLEIKEKKNKKKEK